MGFKWRFLVTLECDSRTSPDCHRALEHESTTGQTDAQAQLVATARRAGWSPSPAHGEWRDRVVCPACRPREPEATGTRTRTVPLRSVPWPGGASLGPEASDDTAVRRLLDDVDRG